MTGQDIRDRIDSMQQEIAGSRRHIAELSRIVNAFRNADESDWEHLDRLLGHGGHGQFWRSVLLGEVKPGLERLGKSNDVIGNAIRVARKATGESEDGHG